MCQVYDIMKYSHLIWDADVGIDDILEASGGSFKKNSQDESKQENIIERIVQKKKEDMKAVYKELIKEGNYLP